MIKVQVVREEIPGRYVLEFSDGKLEWSMFLRDEIYNDPLRFSTFMQRILQEVQLKK